MVCPPFRRNEVWPSLRRRNDFLLERKSLWSVSRPCVWRCLSLACLCLVSYFISFILVLALDVGVECGRHYEAVTISSLSGIHYGLSVVRVCEDVFLSCVIFSGQIISFILVLVVDVGVTCNVNVSLYIICVWLLGVNLFLFLFVPLFSFGCLSFFLLCLCFVKWNLWMYYFCFLVVFWKGLSIWFYSGPFLFKLSCSFWNVYYVIVICIFFCFSFNLHRLIYPDWNFQWSIWGCRRMSTRKEDRLMLQL